MDTTNFIKLSLFAVIMPLAIASLNQNLVAAPIPITPAAIGTTGFTIGSPGDYFLTDDVPYSPTTGKPAITIAASNVTLNLNDQTLSQANSVTGIDGISVICGFENIVIKNGTVRDFSRAGIFACHPAIVLTESDLNALDERDEKRFDLVNNRINSVFKGKRAILERGSVQAIPGVTTALKISKIRALHNGNPTIQNARANGMGGIVIFNAQDTLIENCDMQQNVLAGLLANNVIKFTMDNCHCDDNISGLALNNTNNLQAAGAFILTTGTSIVSDILIHNSTFNRNTGQGGTTQGLSIFNTVSSATSIFNVVLDSVQASDNQCIVNTIIPRSPTVLGIQISDANNVVMNKVTITGLQLILNTIVPGGTNGTIDGMILAFINNLSISNSQVAGISLAANTSAVLSLLNIGMNVQDVNNFAITNCQCTDFSIKNPLGTASQINTAALAFFASSKGIVSNCQFNGCVNTSPNNPNNMVAKGVDIGTCADIVIEDSSASGNTQAATQLISPNNRIALACGFKASGPADRIVFRRCQASNNTDTGAGSAYGFTTTDPFTPHLINDQIVFDSCIAEGNTAVTQNLAAGFDILNATNSKVLNCVADGNLIGIKVSEDAVGISGKNIISANTLLGNTQAGIFDSSANNSNAYYSNRADNNGPNPARTNYLGDIFPEATCPKNKKCEKRCKSANSTPIRLWQLPFAPCKVNTNCVKGEILDNISIVAPVA